MDFDFLKNKTDGLMVLTKNMLRSLEPNEATLDFNIKYWIKTGRLIRLEKGKYILSDVFDKWQDKDAYLEYIACWLVQPSYLSVEYVLAKCQVLSESVHAFTLVTTQKTREISNKLGVFRYYSISPDLFKGFRIKSDGDMVIREATKSKALFDFLYFRFLKKRPINMGSIEFLRLNWENISLKEFQSAKKYLKFTNSKRLRQVFKLIEEKYYDNG